MSPIITIDEIDKVGGDSKGSHLGALYSLLERVSATQFSDSAIGLPIDASYVSWFATCNNPFNLEPALLSRFNVIHIPPPDRKQLRAVIRSIHRKFMAESDWASAFTQEIAEEVIDSLSGFTPREIGRVLEAAFAHAAALGKATLDTDDIRSHRVDNRRPIGFTQ